MAQKQPQKNLLDKLKGLDASGLSPCESELTCHINRSAFTTKMWANADKKEIDQHPKKHDGWELEDDTYNIAWFDGDQFPGTLVPEEDDAVSSVGENDDDFVLSSDDEAGILVPMSRPPQIPNRLTVPDCV